MKVLLVNTNRVKNPFPVVPGGACMVAESAQERGHDVSFLDLLFTSQPQRALERELLRLRPDVVGFSVRNVDNNNMRRPGFFIEDLRSLVDCARAREGCACVIGGAAVCIMPPELLRETGAPWAVLGDGETVFPALLDALEHGRDPRRVDGVGWLEGGAYHGNRRTFPELDASLAAPRLRRWIHLPRYVSRLCTVPLQTKRGCPFECVYCTYPLAEGRDYRMLGPADCVDAVRRLAADGVGDIEFVDNVFNEPYDHALAVCEALARAQTRARFMTIDINPRSLDGALIGAMERAGFAGFGMSVESAADAVLARMKKGYGSAEVLAAAGAVHRSPLPCLWMFLLGGPGETRATLLETLAFARAHIRAHDVAVFCLGVRVYPRTELARIARDEGLLADGERDLVRPFFYFSPQVELDWARKELAAASAAHANFIGPDSFDLPLLPFAHRVAYLLGCRQPLWRHTRRLRRVFGFLWSHA
jgi:radical SAM superfamily enzyme YgiQ (UPF0313 family)